MPTITSSERNESDTADIVLTASTVGLIIDDSSNTVTTVATDDDGIDVVTGGGGVTVASGPADDEIDVVQNTGGTIVVGGGDDEIDVIDNTGGGNDEIDTLQSPLDPADVIDAQPGDTIDVVPNTQGGMVIVGGDDDTIDTLQSPVDPADVIDTQRQATRWRSCRPASRCRSAAIPARSPNRTSRWSPSRPGERPLQLESTAKLLILFSASSR